MTLLLGFIIILLGAFLPETPLEYKLSLSVLLTVVGTVISIYGCKKLLRDVY